MIYNSLGSIGKEMVKVVFHVPSELRIMFITFLDSIIYMIEKRKDSSRFVPFAERNDYCYEKNIGYLYMCSNSFWMRKLRIRFLFR